MTMILTYFRPERQCLLDVPTSYSRCPELKASTHCSDQGVFDVTAGIICEQVVDKSSRERLICSRRASWSPISRAVPDYPYLLVDYKHGCRLAGNRVTSHYSDLRQDVRFRTALYKFVLVNIRRHSH